MPDLQWLEVPEGLRSPVLVTAWSGWNDAAEAATGGVRFLRERWSSSKIASIDPEEFYDFTQARPMIRLVSGNQRALDWPANEFWVSREPLLPHDFVLFVGIEPHLRWRGYINLFLEVIRRLGVTTVVTLGGLIADSTHTRPVPVVGFSNDQQLAARLLEIGARSTNYEGPTGIVGTLHDACRSNSITCVSFWASVPPYITGLAYPKATLALLRPVDDLLGLELDVHELESAAERIDAQVSEAVSRNREIAEYVRRLERAFDEHRETSRPHSPAGEAGSEALFKELEEFLKQTRKPEDEGDQGGL